MNDFEIVDVQGRRFKVTPMDNVSSGFYLSDNVGHLQEIGRTETTNKWIKMSARLSLSPFPFDIEEIGKLIEDHYKS
ncbi:MAG: hypothetical protein NVSMB24_23560 [Mucilaginibacter sp.]